MKTYEEVKAWAEAEEYSRDDLLYTISELYERLDDFAELAILAPCHPAAKAALDLLNAEVAFVGWGSDDRRVLVLNMNDTFAFATADAEEVPPSQWQEVADIYKEFGRDGLTAWTAIRRNAEPIHCKCGHDGPGYTKAKEALLTRLGK